MGHHTGTQSRVKFTSEAVVVEYPGWKQTIPFDGTLGVIERDSIAPFV